MAGLHPSFLEGVKKRYRYRYLSRKELEGEIADLGMRIENAKARFEARYERH